MLNLTFDVHMRLTLLVACLRLPCPLYADSNSAWFTVWCIIALLLADIACSTPADSGLSFYRQLSPAVLFGFFEWYLSTICCRIFVKRYIDLLLPLVSSG